MIKPSKRTRHSQTGSTLIEILITILIVAISVLGIAGLQIRAQQEHQIAYLRTIAINKAQQLLEEARNTYRLSRDGGTAFMKTPGFTAEQASQIYCVSNTCTPAQMWAASQAIWLQDLKQKLPDPAVVLHFIDDQDPARTHELTVAGYQSYAHKYGAPDIPKHPVIGVTIAWKEAQTAADLEDSNCARSGNTEFTSAVKGYRCIYLVTSL